MTAVWARVNTFLLLLVLLVLGGILGVLAARIEGGPLDPPGSPNSPTDSVLLPGTPITGPTTISTSGHYYFTRDINSGLANPIIIAANNVTLDLNGFKLAGGDNVGSTGIIVPAASPAWENIVMRNGTVRDFHVGIDANSGARVRIESVRVLSNIRGVMLGIESAISGCHVAYNSEHGVITLAGISSVIVENCRVGPNGNIGVQFGGANSLITDSYIVGNASGLDVQMLGSRNVVRDSYVGFVSLDGPRNVSMDNACVLGHGNNNVGNIISPADHANITCPP